MFFIELERPLSGKAAYRSNRAVPGIDGAVGKGYLHGAKNNIGIAKQLIKGSAHICLVGADMRSHDVILGTMSGPVVYKGKTFRSTKALIRAEGVVSVGTIESRLNKGWSLEEALKTPLLKEVTYKGKTYRSTRALIHAEGVVSVRTIQSRLSKGWSLEEALKTPVRDRAPANPITTKKGKT